VGPFNLKNTVQSQNQTQEVSEDFQIDEGRGRHNKDSSTYNCLPSCYWFGEIAENLSQPRPNQHDKDLARGSYRLHSSLPLLKETDKRPIVSQLSIRLSECLNFS
jgi:hypothetical protein